MPVRTVPAALAALLLAGAAQGQAAAGPDETVRGGAVWSFISENDVYSGADRNYTNGLQLEYVSEADAVHPWLNELARLQPFVDLSGAELRQGVSVSHKLYTPDDITLADPPPDQRPYAGHLSVTAFAAARTRNQERALSLEIGLVGPSAGGEALQSNWHQLIDGREPRGWDTQLHDEITIALSGRRLARFPGPQIGPLDTDVVAHAGLTLGTVRTDLSGGATVRIGRGLDAELAPPRLRPALSPSGLFRPDGRLGGYLFAGVGGYAVARDLFLDGNTFRDSRSVDRRGLVGDLQAGLALYGGRARFAFTYVVRTEQYPGQEGADQFGAVSVSRAF